MRVRAAARASAAAAAASAAAAAAAPPPRHHHPAVPDRRISVQDKLPNTSDFGNGGCAAAGPSRESRLTPETELRLAGMKRRWEDLSCSDSDSEEPEKFLKQPENREKLHVILGQLAKAAISFQPTEYQVKLLKYHPEITKALKSLTLEQWHAALQDRPEGYPLDESLFAHKSAKETKRVFEDQRKRADELAKRILKQYRRANGEKITVLLLDGHGRMLWHIIDRVIALGLKPSEVMHIVVCDIDRHVHAFHKLAFPSAVKCERGDVLNWGHRLKSHMVIYLNFMSVPSMCEMTKEKWDSHWKGRDFAKLSYKELTEGIGEYSYGKIKDAVGKMSEDTSNGMRSEDPQQQQMALVLSIIDKIAASTTYPLTPDFDEITALRVRDVNHDDEGFHLKISSPERRERKMHQHADPYVSKITAFFKMDWPLDKADELQSKLTEHFGYTVDVTAKKQYSPTGYKVIFRVYDLVKANQIWRKLNTGKRTELAESFTHAFGIDIKSVGKPSWTYQYAEKPLFAREPGFFVTISLGPEATELLNKIRRGKTDQVFDLVNRTMVRHNRTQGPHVLPSSDIPTPTSGEQVLRLGDVRVRPEGPPGVLRVRPEQALAEGPRRLCPTRTPPVLEGGCAALRLEGPRRALLRRDGLLRGEEV